MARSPEASVVETARIAYFDWIGFPRGAEHDLRLVLVASSLAYKAPVHRDATYVVTVRAASYRTTSFTTAYAIHVDGKVTTTGEITMVCLANDLKTKKPIPETALAAFRLDGAQDLSQDAR